MYGHLMRTRFTVEQVAAVAAVLEIDLAEEAFTLDDPPARHGRRAGARLTRSTGRTSPTTTPS